jgi:hypothetical protein
VPRRTSACRLQLRTKTKKFCTARLAAVFDNWAGTTRVGAGLVLAAVCGAPSATHAQDGRVALHVKPVLCITDRREDACMLSIAISWQSDGAGAYCLHSDLAEGPIRCWRGAASGAVVEERVVEESFTYWLTAGASDARVAEATLEVMTMGSDDRRRNRRRRHVWNIL